jgi:hypothetical protein
MPDEFEAARFLIGAVLRKTHALLRPRQKSRECADVIKRTVAQGTFGAGADRIFAGCHQRTVTSHLANFVAARRELGFVFFMSRLYVPPEPAIYQA